jgi:predicted Zn-dependent protease
MDMQHVKVTVDGRPALTIEQIATQLDISVDAAYKLVSRYKLESPGQIGKVYYQADVTATARKRPGTGAPGQPRPARRKAE